MRRIARVAHRGFVDRDQPQLLVLVVTIGQAQDALRQVVLPRERRQLVHEHEIRRAVDRRRRRARQHVEDYADERREAGQGHRDAEDLEAADSHREYAPRGY